LVDRGANLQKLQVAAGVLYRQDAVRAENYRLQPLTLAISAGY
jgi:hypothetical protein